MGIIGPASVEELRDEREWMRRSSEVKDAYPCFCGRESCTEELKKRAALDGADRCTHGEPLDMRCAACLAEPMNDFLREGIYDVSEMD